MLKFLFIIGFLLSSTCVFAARPAVFSGSVRCSVDFSERNLDRGDVGENKLVDLILTKTGYNSWKLETPATITNEGDYSVTLTSVRVSSPRINPQDMHLFFNARLSKGSKVLATGFSNEKESNVTLNLLSTEEEQASVDSGVVDTSELIKKKLLPDGYVRSSYVSCFMANDK